MGEFALQGAFTALVTPFSEDGSTIDWAAYEWLVQSQIDGGISGLVPCGTTGETPTLSDSEQIELVQRTAKLAGGRVPVLAGTGSNNTKKSIDASRAALEAGADAVMIVMPYYNKPTQAGIQRHVELISKAVDAPIVLYNIPGRSIVDMSVDTTLRILDSCSNVVGIKDATGNVLRCQEVKRRAGDRVTVMCGDDGLTLAMMCVGAAGVISVTGNVYPKAVSEVVAGVARGELEHARRKHFALLPVHAAMFVESNPAPAKALLAAKGHMKATVRPPLVPASAEARQHLKSVTEAYEAS